MLEIDWDVQTIEIHTPKTAKDFKTVRWSCIFNMYLCSQTTEDVPDSSIICEI